MSHALSGSGMRRDVVGRKQLKMWVGVTPALNSTWTKKITGAGHGNRTLTRINREPNLHAFPGRRHKEVRAL